MAEAIDYGLAHFDVLAAPGPYLFAAERASAVKVHPQDRHAVLSKVVRAGAPVLRRSARADARARASNSSTPAPSRHFPQTPTASATDETPLHT